MMDTVRENLMAAESACLHLQYGIVTLDAIRTAMVSGPDDPAEYLDALQLVIDFFRDQQCEIGSAIGKAMKGGKSAA